jgi:hypothetical protein
MKILETIQFELKNKKSTRLLLLIIVLVMLVTLSNNFVLLNEYHKIKANPLAENAHYNTLLNQPFSHIKIENSRSIGEIEIAYGDNSKISVSKEYENDGLLLDYIKIKSDTLFISFEKGYGSKSFRYHKFLLITLPQVQSLEAHNAEVLIKNLNQNTLSTALENSELEVLTLQTDIKILKSNLQNKSVLKINSGALGHKIDICDANLNTSSTLDLSGVNIDSLSFNTNPDSKVTLSTETLKKFMKK